MRDNPNSTTPLLRDTALSAKESVSDQRNPNVARVRQSAPQKSSERGSVELPRKRSPDGPPPRPERLLAATASAPPLSAAHRADRCTAAWSVTLQRHDARPPTEQDRAARDSGKKNPAGLLSTSAPCRPHSSAAGTPATSKAPSQRHFFFGCGDVDGVERRRPVGCRGALKVTEDPLSAPRNGVEPRRKVFLVRSQRVVW